MESSNDFNIDEETISKMGLRLSDRLINAQITPDARVFIYPFLEDVFVMENDLYGNKMPKDSCFLAFTGQHGLMGKHLKVETLKNATIKEIKEMVEINQEG
ncbi:MAG TPA: hypothetical protein VEZ55_06405 [Chitinophagaceae bacterium]|jgi:hypothetical protein|nr:hypothetical protein [Chitinophagaceae bacterium]